MTSPDFTQNYFQLFDLPVQFDVDSPTLGERYRQLQRELHPDRFADDEDITNSSEVTISVFDQTAHGVVTISADGEITYDHFASIIRFMLYAPESSAAVPLTIDRAAREHDFRPIAAQAMLTLERIAGSMASGMHNSVMCTEDYPFATLDDETLARLEETYLTAGLAEGIDALCSRWPRGTMDANLRDPLTTDLPVLVLSGEHDPITPPRWGEAIMPGLANARHLIAPGQGHGVIARGCVPKLAARFINELELSELDESCLEDLVPFPFFTDLLGPAP